MARVRREGLRRERRQAVRFAFTELPLHQELRDKLYREIALEQLGRLQVFLEDRITKGEFRSLRTEIAARAFQGMEEIPDEVVRLFLHGALDQGSSQPKSTSERSDHATSD